MTHYEVTIRLESGLTKNAVEALFQDEYPHSEVSVEQLEAA